MVPGEHDCHGNKSSLKAEILAEWLGLLEVLGVLIGKDPVSSKHTTVATVKENKHFTFSFSRGQIHLFSPSMLIFLQNKYLHEVFLSRVCCFRKCKFPNMCLWCFGWPKIVSILDHCGVMCSNISSSDIKSRVDKSQCKTEVFQFGIWYYLKTNEKNSSSSMICLLFSRSLSNPLSLFSTYLSQPSSWFCSCGYSDLLLSHHSCEACFLIFFLNTHFSFFLSKMPSYFS